MGTPYNKIYVLFQDRIEKDSKFYIKTESNEINKEFAQMRMKKLLQEAVYYLYSYDDKDKDDFQVNFHDKDDALDEFLFDLTDNECHLLADVMFKQYIDKEVVAKLNALRSIGFKDDELVQFSPANTLKEFNSSIELLRQKTNAYIKACKKRDRATGKYISFNYNFE